jgi:hypothetical protein
MRRASSSRSALGIAALRGVRGHRPRRCSCLRRAFRFLQPGIARGEAAECHIDDSLVCVRADISRTTHHEELLRELRTLLASCRDRSVSRWTGAATGRARGHSVRVGTNPQGLCYLRGRATSDKSSNANCQSQGEHCSHKCAPPCTFRLIDFFAPFYPATLTHPESSRFAQS